MFDWLIDLLYQGIITVCMLILNIVKSVLTLIFDIANITLFSDETVSELLTRVYIIIGVLMLFKITISCIQYLVNPDKMEDKESGFGGIAKRAIISVLLLALVPGIFEFAKLAQGAIIEALPKVILGQKDTGNIENMGEEIANVTALSFFSYSSDACNDGSLGGTSSKFSSVDSIIKNTGDIVGATCNGERRYSFNWILCLPAAVFLVVILVSMVLDVGVRAIKFGFLEIIAPIPIASYIDPKTSKKSFDSWVHNCITVYTDLFIRLGVIYLILYLFRILQPILTFQTSLKLNDGTVLSAGRTKLINAAIIIALFMFAKNAPKFISDVLGLKGDGNIGDMFKRAAGLGMSPVTGLRAGINAYRSSKDYGEKNGKALRRAFSGAVGGSLRTAAGAVNGKKAMETYKSAFDKTKAVTNRKLEYANRYPNFSERMERRMTESWDRFSGITTAGEKANADISAANMGIDTRKYAWDRAEAKVLEAPGKYSHIRATIKDSSGIDRSYNVSEMLTRIDILSNDISQERFTGELQFLKNNRQEILDTAKVEHIRAALTRDPGTDTALANELAERVLKLARSGSSSEFVNKQFLGQFSELFDKLKKGDASPTLTSAEAEAIAKYIKGGLNKDAGAARLKALETQTSVPKGDGK